MRVWLESIAIRDFRNLERVDLEIPAEGIALIGDNGHGKTNFLEAIYYLQILRSVRDARDQDLTRFDANGFHISAIKRQTEEYQPAAGSPQPAATSLESGGHQIAVGFDKTSKRKKVTIDGASPRRLSDALGALPSVMFSPRDLELVSGAPSERRRYIDLVLALTDRKYLHALQHYRANLVRRNAALRDAARRGGGSADDRVAVWEPALAEHGTVLIEARAKWVEDSAAEFTRLSEMIGEQRRSEMRYISPFAESEARHDVLLAAFEEKRGLDIKRGLTHVGPHRDDLELTLDGRELRLFGSAGQQRTAAIAMRMLEAATLRAHAGAEPILLLDDPFAELDTRRAARILELLQKGGLGQTLLAVPRESDIPAELIGLERWSIRNGSIDPRF
jgi:DNA replication and repair protein RecF